jgi:hypothetical protein
MPVYAGIDVHRKRSQVAVVDDAGAVLKNRNVVNCVDTILSLIGKSPTHPPVAFEAVYGWSWLVELLDDNGYEPHLVHPDAVQAIASARLKNDEVDAATLAKSSCSTGSPTALPAASRTASRRSTSVRRGGTCCSRPPGCTCRRPRCPPPPRPAGGRSGSAPSSSGGPPATTPARCCCPASCGWRTFGSRQVQDGRNVAGAGAGAVARLGSGVADASNEHGESLDWSELVATVARVFPGRPLVGHEGGDDLSAALASGFIAVGPLRVWVP